MSKKRIQRRIPFQVAAHRLRARLDASPGEIALWVAGFVSGAKLTAFTSEIDDAARFDFQSAIHPNEPDWLDYNKQLSGCYFDERAVDAIAPAERFISMREAVAYLEEITGGMPDAAGFIRSRVENDGLLCLHPIAGIPDLGDKSECEGALLPREALENAVHAYFGPDLNRSAPRLPMSGGARQHISAILRGRVAWRRILNEHIAEIDLQHRGKATVHQVLRWLRERAGDRILPEGGADTLAWLDDEGARQTVRRATVMNAISEARRLGKHHG